MVVVYFWIFKPCFFLNPRGITLPWFSSLEERGVVDLNSFKEEHAVVFLLSGGAVDIKQMVVYLLCGNVLMGRKT